MYIKRNYGFLMTLNWSKRPLVIGTAYSFFLCLLSFIFNKGLYLPWSPIGVIGLAVAFYLGFKNNSSYDRTWEARKIWGSIVNNSRTFGAAVVAFVKGKRDEEVKKELIYRHIAWLTALQHQLRLSRPWEHQENRLNRLYAPNADAKYQQQLEAALAPYISEEELKSLESVANKATQLLKIQAIRLQELKNHYYFDDFRHMEFHRLIQTFYDGQGKSERIKNFPFPRQYASTALWMTFLFSGLVPLGLIDIFRNTNGFVFWLSPFISGLIIWVFFLMEKIGDYSENPFEGTYNDVPITNIARAIEIDMRQMIDDENIPPAVADENGFLM